MIFVIDSDDPMSAEGRRQDPDSLINYVESIVRDTTFAERVFLAPAAQELDSWIPSIRKSLEADSKTWREQWYDISDHFQDASASTTDDEAISDFDATLAEIMDEKHGDPKGETMDLTGILEFISPNSIRIKGTRIDIEFVIEEFLYGSNPKRIERRYPNLTPLQIYGSLTYYLLNQERMDAYIETGRAAVRAVIEKHRRDRSASSSSSGGSSQLPTSSASGREKTVIRESAVEMVQVDTGGSAKTKTGNLNIRDIFDFISSEAIRIKGTRVGIEIVIERFLDDESPDEIRRHHPLLTPLQNIWLDNLLSAKQRGA